MSPLVNAFAAGMMVGSVCGFVAVACYVAFLLERK